MTYVARLIFNINYINSLKENSIINHFLKLYKLIFHTNNLWLKIINLSIN